MQSKIVSGEVSSRLGGLLSASSLQKHKKRVILFSVALFIFSTALALYQPINPNINSSSTGLQSFFYPKESNPQLRLAGVGAQLSDMAVVGEKIWVVGEQGTILHSGDGGVCWRPQGRWISVESIDVTTGKDAESMVSGCVNDQTGVQRLFSLLPSFAANLSNELSAFPKAHAEGEKTSRNSKANKRPEYKQDSVEQVTVSAMKSRSSYNRSPVERDKSEYTDGRRVPENYVPELLSVAFADDSKGVAVGERGIILLTSDGGETWSNAMQHSEFDLYSVAYRYDPSEQRGSIIAVGQNGVILISKDLGRRWEGFRSDEGQDLLNVSINNRGHIVVVGKSGMVVHSQNDGRDWMGFSTENKKGYDSAIVDDNNRIYVGGADGTIRQSDANNLEWRLVQNRSDSKIISLDSKRRTLVSLNDENDLLILATDQGQTRKLSKPESDERFIAVKLINESRAIVASEEGILYGVDIAQNHWKQLTNDIANSGNTNLRYSVSVAPWWYLVSMICAGLILIVVWPREDGPSPEEGIAGMAASDRPLQPGDPDALNLGKIATDVTSFLSNPKTTAPLTLAITGPWGCGKSSLMNLIRANLKERGFLPVWFNAWHHQKGEQLLASLFAHITQQAIPPWFSFDGVIFRARLIAIRGRRHWFIFALMMFLLFMTWAINDGDVSLVSRLQSMNWSEFWAGLFGHSSAAAQNNQVQMGSGLVPMMASLLGVAAPLFALIRTVRGFGISPEKLVSVDHRNKNQKGYDPGARARFADEFADVTTALGSNKMVIFIDDLDRCSQENLIDILENINFISSSGDCYLLLGMAPKYIEACVANAYETLAQNIAEKERFEESMMAESDKIRSVSNKERHKFSFAHQYLEKMINIEVAIPSMSENSIERLLHQSEKLEEELDDSSSILKRLIAGIKPLFSQINRGMPLIFIVVAIIAGWDYGKSVPDKPKPQPPSVVNLGTIDAESLANLISSQPELDIDNRNLPNRDFQLSIQADQKLVTNGLKVASLGSGQDKVSLILSMNEAEEKEQSNNSGQTGTSRSNRNTSSSATANDATRASRSDSIQESDDLSDPGVSFRSESREVNPRLSGAVLLLFVLLFSSFSLYVYRQQKQKFSKDSDDFKNALVRWTPWIQIKQETPRAIKRFLNHLRYQSIRNRKAISESLLVAYASIAFFEKTWILNDNKFDMICEGRISELLALEYQTAQDKKETTNRWEKLAERMSGSLAGVDKQLLRDNRQHALNVLQSDTLEEHQATS